MSVIIPVYNNPSGLGKLLDSLLEQTYPKEWYEIIVVDNGSKDLTCQKAQAYAAANPKQICVLQENQIQSSYAARNRGVAAARGQIIAFTDADCIPVSHWLEEGVRALIEKEAFMVGGKVKFTFSAKRSSAEMFDAIKNLQVKSYIETKHAAPTANLFVRRSVFDRMGFFNANMKSGGDFLWTRQASKAGYKLVYSENAEVLHPARHFSDLVRKQYRVGGGILSSWKDVGKSNSTMLILFLRGFFPNRPRVISRLIQENGDPDMNHKFLSIWLTAWICNIVTSMGILLAFFAAAKMARLR